MRILNTGTEVEAAVADALVRRGGNMFGRKLRFLWPAETSGLRDRKSGWTERTDQEIKGFVGAVDAVGTNFLFLPGFCIFQLLGDSRSKVQRSELTQWCMLSMTLLKQRSF